MDSNLTPGPDDTHGTGIDAIKILAGSCQCVSEEKRSLRRNVTVLICK